MKPVFENKVTYKSTRSQKDVPGISAAEAILRGIAEDGGLYVPSRIPKLEKSLNELVKMNYHDLAYLIMKDFLPDFEEETLKQCIKSAYDDKFDTGLIAPLADKADIAFLELYHGPTLAFKDMALSILPYLLKTSMKKLNIDKEVVILTATSGDTGKAALEGFSDVQGFQIIVFFPQEGVSEIQKKQMLTQLGSNTFVVGIQGNFDDAQNGVKQMFTDDELLHKLEAKGYLFSSANSINIGRLIPQVVYYFHAYLQACRAGTLSIGNTVNFSVPTGNFGNILAAYLAKEMGLPIHKLICASNENKVLYDFFNTGVYDKNRQFYTTASPSMDILISSNLERLLSMLCTADSNAAQHWMQQLSDCGGYAIEPHTLRLLSDFHGEYATEAETMDAIQEVFNRYAYVIDTHTAVAYTAFKKYQKQHPEDQRKTIIVSTASPYKFAADVMRGLQQPLQGDDFELIKALSQLSGNPIPKNISDLETLPIRHKKICKKDEMKSQVEDILAL